MGGPFSLTARKELTLVPEFWELYIYTVPKPIAHNPDVSLPLIISGHGFYGYPWLSRLEGGQFSSAARKELTLILDFGSYIYCNQANRA